MKTYIQILTASTAVAFCLNETKTAANEITLDFNSLPNAQGWVFSGGPASVESNVFSVSGGILHQNSIGIGRNSTSGEAYYQFGGIVDPALPFTLTARVRVNNEEYASLYPQNAYGFAIEVSDGAAQYSFGLGFDSLQVSHYPSASLPVQIVDTTSLFHDYRLEGGGGSSSFSLYVDDVLFDTGPNASIGDINTIFLGDFTQGRNVSADIASFSFSQVPEPSTGFFGDLTLFYAAFRRRREGRNG